MTTWDTQIPPGREHLYRHQAAADAEVERLDAEWKAAEQRAREARMVLDPDDSFLAAVDDDIADRLDKRNRAVAVADRVYQERTAGLSGWIDCNPHLPVCSACGGTGGEGSDVNGSCRTCGGWGREDDGRPSIPVWREADKHGPAAWVDSSTGREVDLLVDPTPPTAAPKEAVVRTLAQCTVHRGCTRNNNHRGDCHASALQERYERLLDWLREHVWPSDLIGSKPPPKRQTAADIEAAVDAALTQRSATEATPPPDGDTYDRPNPQPQDLDAPTPARLAITSGPGLNGSPIGQTLQLDLGGEWCTCGWIAGAHRHDTAPALNLGGFTPPPSDTPTAPTKP